MEEEEEFVFPPFLFGKRPVEKPEIEDDPLVKEIKRNIQISEMGKRFRTDAREDLMNSLLSMPFLLGVDEMLDKLESKLKGIVTPNPTASVCVFKGETFSDECCPTITDWHAYVLTQCENDKAMAAEIYQRAKEQIKVAFSCRWEKRRNYKQRGMWLGDIFKVKIKT